MYAAFQERRDGAAVKHAERDGNQCRHGRDQPRSSVTDWRLAANRECPQIERTLDAAQRRRRVAFNAKTQSRDRGRLIAKHASD